MRFFSIVRFYIVKNQGLSLHVLRVLIPMLVLFARAASFGNFSCWFYVGIQLLPKLRKTCGLKSRSVPFFIIGKPVISFKTATAFDIDARREVMKTIEAELSKKSK